MAPRPTDERYSPNSQATRRARWWTYPASGGLAGQGASFVLVGGALVLVDWSVFVALSALGIMPIFANVAGRLVGALLGFWLNGHITFAHGGTPRLGRGRFMRYGSLWAALTALSTLSVVLLTHFLGLQFAWLVKPVVEVCMAALSFLVSRHWVYR